MTIKQFAEKQGISSQAVYQRLKKNKIRVETMTEKGTGELTGEGMAILDKLFSAENRQTKPPKDELIEALNNQITTLREKNVELMERVKNLEAANQSLKEDKERLFTALDKAQEMKGLLLPAAGGGSERLTWRERLTGRRNTK